MKKLLCLSYWSYRLLTNGLTMSAVGGAPWPVTGAPIILIAGFASSIFWNNNMNVINLTLSVSCFAECSLFSTINK